MFARIARNSVFPTSCDAWFHKKRSGKEGRLVDITDIKPLRCLGLAHTIDGRPIGHGSLGDQELDMVESFVYLGDTLFPNGGCEVSTIARIHSARGKFCELLPMLTTQATPLEM